MILKPNFETPVDTIKDVLEQNLTLHVWPTGESIVEEYLSSSPHREALNLLIMDPK